MPFEDTKRLQFNQYQKSDKALFLIYANLECLIKKMNGCKNNPKNASATKIDEYIPSSLQQCLQQLHSLTPKKIRMMYAQIKYCLKIFCESLREHVINIINFKKKS